MARLRYSIGKDIEDALDLCDCTGGAVLNVNGEFRVYSQLNRLYLDFPNLKAPWALCKESIRTLKIAGFTDDRIIKEMRNWCEPPEYPYGIGEEWVKDILKEMAGSEGNA